MNRKPVTAGLCMTPAQKCARADSLRHLAKLHIDKWLINGDIKLSLIADQLKTAATHWTTP